MNQSEPASSIPRLFAWICDHAIGCLIFSGLLVIGTGVWLPRLAVDSSADAFLPSNDPTILFQNQVKETFGLGDSILILVVNDGSNGIFNPATLQLVKWLTERVSELPEMDPDRITSLATENNIAGTADGIEISLLLDGESWSQADADEVREAVMGFPAYVGSLVSADGKATVVAVEILDSRSSSQVYGLVREILGRAPVTDESIHVGGEIAVSAQLGASINADMGRLNLLCGLVITFVLFLSYRTLGGILLPSLIVAGTVAVVLGSMAFFEQPFYIITNALPVILIAMGVADGIHILGQYYEEIAHDPKADSRDLVLRTMGCLWRPITITSVTDMAGFLAIHVSSDMPPMKAFGLFAAMGAGMAWFFSMLALPAVLSLMKPFKNRKAEGAVSAVNTKDRFGGLMSFLGAFVIKRYAAIVAFACLVTLVGAIGAAKLEVNEDRISNFKQSGRSLDRTA